MLLTFPGRSIGTAGVSVGSGSSVGLGVSVGSGSTVGIGVSTGSEDGSLVAAGVSVGSADVLLLPSVSLSDQLMVLRCPLMP